MRLLLLLLGSGLGVCRSSCFRNSSHHYRTILGIFLSLSLSHSHSHIASRKKGFWSQPETQTPVVLMAADQGIWKKRKWRNGFAEDSAFLERDQPLEPEEDDEEALQQCDNFWVFRESESERERVGEG